MLENLLSTAETGITRRNFLLGSTVGLFWPSLPRLVTGQQSIITFEDAKKDVSLRQEYIDQLVKRLFGEEALIYLNGGFVYDHDGDKADEKLISIAKKLSEDPHYYEILANQLRNNTSMLSVVTTYYENDARFSKYGIGERKTKIEEFLKTEEGVKDYGMKVLVLSLGIPTVSRNMSSSPIYPFNFGKKVKSEIFINKGAFEDSYISARNNSRIPLPISEEAFIETLKHEFKHVKDQFEGIYGDDFEISESNFDKVDQRVTRFVLESRAYRNGIENTRKLNKNSGNEFEKYHPSYLIHLIGLTLEVNAINRLKGLFDLYSDGILNKHLTSLNEFIVEARQVLADVDRIYSR